MIAHLVPAVPEFVTRQEVDQYLTEKVVGLGVDVTDARDKLGQGSQEVVGGDHRAPFGILIYKLVHII